MHPFSGTTLLHLHRKLKCIKMKVDILALFRHIHASCKTLIAIVDHMFTICLMFSFTQERDMTMVDPLWSLNNILMLTRQRRVSPDQNTRWYSLVWSSIQLALSGSGLGFCKALYVNSDISIHNGMCLCPLFMVTRTTLALPPCRSPRVVPLPVAPYCWV